MEPRRPFLLRAPDLCFSLGTAFLRLAVCTENLSSGVVLVKSAKDGVSFDASDSLNRTKNRRILVQGSMRSEVIIIVGVRFHNSAQMRLAQDNDVVHTFTPDRADQPFGKPVLPG